MKGSDKEASVSTINVMKETFQSSDETNMENLVHLIHETDEANTWFGSVRTIKKDFVLPKGQSTKIHCRANYIAAEPRTPVIFEPDTLILIQLKKGFLSSAKSLRFIMLQTRTLFSQGGHCWDLYS